MIKKVVLGILILLIVSVGVSTIFIIRESKETLPSLGGQVLDARTGKPIEGMIVRREVDMSVFPFSHPGSGEPLLNETVTTGPDGKYYFPKTNVKLFPLLGSIEVDYLRVKGAEDKSLYHEDDTHEDASGNLYILDYVVTVDGKPFDNESSYYSSGRGYLKGAEGKKIDIHKIPVIQNIAECQDMLLEPAVEKCVSHFSRYFAAEKDDVSFCNQIDDAERDRCLYTAAQANNNLEHCDLILGDHAREVLCIERVSERIQWQETNCARDAQRLRSQNYSEEQIGEWCSGFSPAGQ